MVLNSAQHTGSRADDVQTVVAQTAERDCHVTASTEVNLRPGWRLPQLGKLAGDRGATIRVIKVRRGTTRHAWTTCWTKGPFLRRRWRRLIAQVLRLPLPSNRFGLIFGGIGKVCRHGIFCHARHITLDFNCVGLNNSFEASNTVRSVFHRRRSLHPIACQRTLCCVFKEVPGASF